MEEQDRDQSRAVWDDMATGWDRHRDFMWRTTGHVASWLVDNVEPQAGDTILDLAGGPGDSGFLAAERVGPSGRVIETDFAPQMVAVAERRASELGLDNVETRVIDAEELDLDDHSIDGIICRWGFMLMLDPQGALEQCRRVLKEGRRLTFSVWGAAEKNPWVTIIGMTMMQMGHQPGGHPYGPGGMFSMSDPKTIEAMVRRAGFANVTASEMSVDWTYGSFEEAWDYMTQVAGWIAALVKQLPEDEVLALRSALEANVKSYRTGSGITLPGVTVNVCAF